MRRTPYYPPVLAALLALASLATPAGVQARVDSQPQEGLRSLTPGDFVVQEQVVPVDIVVQHLIRAADDAAGKSLEAFQEWDFIRAATLARQAYSLVTVATRQIGASTPTLDAARQMLSSPIRRIVCTIRHPFD
jgi:hypothetical protein